MKKIEKAVQLCYYFLVTVGVLSMISHNETRLIPPQLRNILLIAGAVVTIVLLVYYYSKKGNK